MFDTSSFYMLVLNRLRNTVPPWEEVGVSLWQQQAQAYGVGSCSSDALIALFKLIHSKSLSAMADYWVNKHEKLCHWPKCEPKATCLS